MSIVSQANHLEKHKLFCFNSNRLSHAYITDNSFADTLATAVVCNTRNGKRPCLICTDCNKATRRIHPDIIEITKLDDKLIITVDQIRALKKDVYIVPNDSIQKAYIVKNADSMNVNAQNAFLQILEEPPKHAVFILCTENPTALLPTIRSRCVELKSLPESDFTDEEESEELDELANNFTEAIKRSNVKLIECMFQIDKLDRQALGSFLVKAREQIILTLREDVKKGAQNNKSLINAEEVINKAEEMLALNVSSGNISGYICASMVSE